MNPFDWFLLAVLVLLAFLAARYSWRHRHSACGGDCSACPYHNAECEKACRQHIKKEKENRK